MDFHADDDFPIAGLTLDEFGSVHAALHQLAGLWRNWAAVSIAAPALRMVASSKALPINCSPRGRPFSLKAAGTAKPGKPARLTVTVNTSFKYMETGSEVFSPMAKAGPGVAGVKSTSHRSNARVKSREI